MIAALQNFLNNLDLTLNAGRFFLVFDQIALLHSVHGISPAVGFYRYVFTDMVYCELWAGQVLAIHIYYDIQDQV